MREAVEAGQVDRAEWRRAWGWAFAVVALSCVPYLYAYAAAPPGQTFGGFLVNTQDGNSYLAKMRQGYEGAWLFRLPFTPEDQRGIFTYTFYLALGHIARLFGAPLIVIFHLARVASGLFFLLTVYRLAAALTPDLSARRWAFAVAAFGSGLAVLSLLIGRSDPKNFVPVDLFVTEVSGFYSILANPHFPFSFALEAWAIIWVLRPARIGLGQQIGVAVAIGLGIGLVAPYLSPAVWAAVIAGAIIAPLSRRDAILRAATLTSTTGVVLLYDVWILRTNSAVAAWAQQSITPSPPVMDYLLGLGLWLPLAFVGLWHIRRSELGRWDLGISLAAWIAAIAVLVYSPHPLQRRFVAGVFVPVAMLAGVGLPWLWAKMSLLRLAVVVKPISAALVLLLGFTTNVLVLAALFTGVGSYNPMIYLTNDEASALRWLDTQTDSTDIVLADARLGNFVPGWTGARVVYGHPMETIDATVKRAEVDSYFAAGDSAVLGRYPITYIIGGTLPTGWHSVFTSGEITIYGR